MAAVSEKFVNRLVIAAVSVGFLTLLIVAGVAGYSVWRNISYTQWVSHTYQVQRSLSEYRILNERVETARRGFLLSQNPSFETTFRATADSLPGALDEVARLTSDNPAQQARITRLRALLHDQLAAAEESIRLVRAGSSEPRNAFNLDRGVVATREVRAVTLAMDEEESRLLKMREGDRIRSLDTLVNVSVAAILLLALVAIGSVWTILRYTRDLATSRQELEDLNAGLEDAVRTRTADLQRANEEIQRFAYIVSHDLRSPLVNVMGFTSELEASAKPMTRLLDRAEAEAPQIVSADARTAIRDDLPESIGFIRTSTQKMDRLINAILQLSRQGRRVLAPEPLDMQRLLGGIADNLKHRTEELGATIEVAPGAPPIVSDRLALDQVFSNLIENAVKYAKPGRPLEVVIRGRRERHRVVYEIQDNGRGIDPKDHERIFELFRRSGSQDQPGEGIGLAHVRALAYRLGGTVTCDSALDQGATFRVSLPAQLVLEGEAA